MMVSKKGAESVIGFLMGLILVALAILFFFNLIYSCVKPEDRSSKSFNNLVVFLEEFSKPTSESKLDAQFVTLHHNELLLFFNRGENYSVKLKAPRISLEKTSVSESENILNTFLKRRNELRGDILFGITFFKKPSSCGDDACMVLCKDFKAYLPINLRRFVSNNFDYISNEFMSKTLAEMVIISCDNPKRLKVFPNIDKFYRKLYSYNLYDGESPDDPITVSSNGFKYPNGEFVYDGAILFSGDSSFLIPGKASSDFKEGSSRDIELDRLYKSRAGLWELTSDNNIDLLTLLETSAVYFQRHGSDDIAMCYLFPCLSMTDELYINWNKHINACLESSEDCISLSVDIEHHAKDKLVFRTDNKILSIKQGEQDFFFNNDIDLLISFKREDKEEGISFVKELSLEYDYDAAVKKVRLDANNKEYSFIGITSDTEGLKPKLEFLVKEYEPSS